jgi:hypothetical protein
MKDEGKKQLSMYRGFPNQLYDIPLAPEQVFPWRGLA